MKRYKVLSAGKISPYKKMKYVSGKEYVCANFDADILVDCSTGYYATDLDGLCFAYRPGMSIYECDVDGQSVEYDQFKMRYERFVLGKKLSRAEVVSRMRSRAWDWDVEHATFPVDPFKIKRTRVTRREIALCETWASVRDSVWASVRDSVWASVWASVRDSVWASVRASVWASVGDSVGDSVWASVWASVRDSVWASVWASVRDSVGDSVWAYTSSLFPTVKKWEYIEHKQGKNPYQSGIDLWHAGLVPSYDGETWRVHNRDRILWEAAE